MSLLLGKSAEATKDMVFSIKAPRATGRWFPISHGTMVEVVQAAVQSSGLRVVREKYGLMGKGGEKFFGTMDVVEPDADPNKPYNLVIGVRNSIDKSMAAGLCFGAHVTVCDNMCFSGEVTILRKHTKGIMRVLPQAAIDAVKKFPGFVKHQDQLFQKLMTITPNGSPVEPEPMHVSAEGWVSYKLKSTTAAVDHLLMDAYRLGVVPSSGVGKVYDIWMDPPHDEFRIASAWSLYNAFTEYMKQLQETNPEEAASRTIRLTGLFHDRFVKRAA